MVVSPVRAFLNSQQSRFLAVGAATTLLDAGVFVALTAAGFPVRPSNVASYSMGAVASFHLNRGWTFAARTGPVVAQAVRFAIMVAIGMAVSTEVVALLTPELGPVVAKAVAVVVTVVVNFTIARLFVFREPGQVNGSRLRKASGDLR